MKITDRVYGQVVIDQPVLVELLASPSVLRLKKISQHGVPDKYYHVKNYSRYEHSVGVVLLLKELNASLEEQVAGLLHDVSHTAFSHLIDYLVGSTQDQSYQDSNHAAVIGHSELPAILERHGLNPDRIANFHHFLLLDREIPDLCADRIDYTLRECSADFPGDINQCLEGLTTYQGKVVFRTEAAAELFGRAYMQFQRDHWGGVEAMLRYHLFLQVLKAAMAEKLMTFADFMTDEEVLLQKVERVTDLKAQATLKLLTGPLSEQVIADHRDILKSKFRYVDPEFIDRGRLRRISQTVSGYQELIDQARATSLNYR